MENLITLSNGTQIQETQRDGYVFADVVGSDRCMTDAEWHEYSDLILQRSKNQRAEHRARNRAAFEASRNTGAKLSDIHQIGPWKRVTRLVIVHQPACSNVLLVRPGSVTRLVQNTASFCEAFAHGWVNAQVWEYHGQQSISTTVEELRAGTGDAVLLFNAGQFMPYGSFQVK